MVFQIVKLKRVSSPYFNDLENNTFFDSRVRSITSNLYSQIRKTPELLAMLNTLISEHFLGNVDFFSVDGKSFGRNKLKKINKLWLDQNVQGNAIYGMAMDFFIDGSCFGWVKSSYDLMNDKQKETILKLKAVSDYASFDIVETAKFPRKVSYIPASTVEIKHNESNILYYVQNVNNTEIRWDVDEVIHIKQMEFNGEVRGMSPLKALIKEIVMMYLLKDNLVAQINNGGSPNYIISLKNANGSSKARFERLRLALESFSHIRKSHGNMPIDADVNVHKLGTELKDMEYRELAMFIISEFALVLGLPTSRIPFLMTGSGGSTSKGQLSSNSDNSYQMMINNRRLLFENALNRKFMESGFMFRFRRNNLQDDVRETQASMQRASYVSEVNNVLSRNGKQLTLQAQLSLLSGKKVNITEQDVEDFEGGFSHSTDFSQSNGGVQPFSSVNNIFKGQVSQDLSNAKKRTAFNNGVSL